MGPIWGYLGSLEGTWGGLGRAKEQGIVTTYSEQHFGVLIFLRSSRLIVTVATRSSWSYSSSWTKTPFRTAPVMEELPNLFHP